MRAPRRSVTTVLVVTVSLLVTSALTAPARAAASPDTDDAPRISRRHDGSRSYRDPALVGRPTSRVSGRLQSVADDDREDHADGRDRILITTSGDVLPVALDVPPALADETASVEITADVVMDSARASRPAPVAAARLSPVAEAPTAPVALRARVVVVSNSGRVASDAAIAQRVDAGLAYWRAEGGSAVSSARRVGRVVRYASRLRDPCGFRESQAAFAEAADHVPALSDGEHVIIVVSSACDGTGVGSVGSDLSSSGFVLMSDVPAVFTATFAHELGHNLGLDHANLLCRTCKESQEYRDLYSVMGLAVEGRAAPYYEPPALDSAFRTQLDLADSSEVRVVEPTLGSEQTFTLRGRGGSDGPRGLEVRDDGQSAWIELRDGSGRDAATFYARSQGRPIGEESYPIGVTIATRESDSDAPLDLQEPSSGIAAWQAGEIWTARSDADLRIRVDDVDVTSGSATVTVTRGTPGPPSVTTTGTPRVGSAVSARPSGWGDVALTYVWSADAVPIPGATGRTYAPVAKDVGRRLAVQVTGAPEGVGRTVAASDPTDPVAVGRLDGTVRLSSSPHVGASTHAIVSGLPTGTRRQLEWSVGGSVVPGATTSTYRPTTADWRRGLTVRVTASRDGYASSSVTTRPALVARGALRSARPRITGTSRVGRTLTVRPGRWSPGPRFSYRWYADGRAISGATDSTLRLASRLRGHRISVRVVGRATAYASASRTSGRTRPVRS